MKRNIKPRLVPGCKWLCWVLLLTGFCVKAQAVQLGAADTVPTRSGIFDRLIHTASEKRVEIAQQIYKKNCRKISEAQAMRKLDQLVLLARKLDDPRLECSVFDMRADYYSVNRKFNPLSTSYYQRAIDFAHDNKLIFETGLYLQRKAIYYYVYKQNVTACEYFLQARDVFKDIGYANVPNISERLAEIGIFYYSIGDYSSARSYFRQALVYVRPVGRNYISINNSLGLISRNFKQFPNALRYFDQALKTAVAQHDTIWAAIATGNIGSVYFLQGDYSRAMPFVAADYITSLKYHEHANAAFALMRLVKINLNAGRMYNAKTQLDTVDGLAKNITADALPVMLTYNELMSEYYERIGVAANALLHRKKYDEIKDSLNRRDNIAAVEAVRLRSEIEKRMTLLAKVKTSAQIDALKRNAVIAVLALLIVIFVLVFNRFKQKTKSEKAALEAEKHRIDEELANAITELMHYTESLQQKNIVIDRFASEIEALKERYDDSVLTESLEKLMDAHLMTDENWAEFKRLFAKVHPRFFNTLRQNFPNLSENDHRLLSLIKLGLGNREIANMLGITLDAVKKAKQRLRRKMDIAIYTELESVVAVI